MRISYCSSDVCSSDLARQRFLHLDQADVAVAADHQLRGRDVGKVRGADREAAAGADDDGVAGAVVGQAIGVDAAGAQVDHAFALRSEEHTSELQSLMRISYAVFCLKKKKK